MHELVVRCMWNPTTEVLPETGKMVLMCYSSGNMYVGCVRAVCNNQPFWCARNINSPGLTTVTDPDYWTQLPEPPQND